VAVDRFPIEEGHVLLFARAIGDPNPVYVDRDLAAKCDAGGIIAPPTFVQASAQFDPDYPLRPHEGQPWFGSGGTPTGVHPASDDANDSGMTGGGGLHAEQRFEYHRNLRVGDILSAETKPGRTWQKQGRRAGALMFSEFVTEYRDASGELVVTATTVGVRTENVPERSGP
jgi:hypothetical protein